MLSTVPGPDYAYYSGTPMATPDVSGVSALVKSRNPAITAVQLCCLLDLTADDLMDRDGLVGRDYSTG